ncbi:MAG: AraC family transcriptional regulator, partial [Rhizobiales bacterium]|nr:AraC family transcriptional regulator [Hyphomicrobiales bacterium]
LFVQIQRSVSILTDKLNISKIQETIPLVEIAHNCGFSSQSHLGRVFKQHMGLSPHQYKLTNLL